MLHICKPAYLLILALILFSKNYANETIAQTPANDLYTSPPVISLDSNDNKRLKKGKPLYKQIVHKGHTQNIVVFRIDASKEKIWQTILNYSAYSDWIKNVDHAQIYRQEDRHYYVNFLISHWLLGTFHYSIKHYLSEHNWMKWQLDKARTSDFSLSIGYWQVIEAENEAGKNDVFYSADFQFREPRTEFIRKKAIKAGLKQASIWLPREAEK